MTEMIHGGSKSGRRHLQTQKEFRLLDTEACQDRAELESWHRWEESEPLRSPFAVREHPTGAELRKFL
ncbi:MAG: hypothetical protein A3J09_01905 [Candidatus Zambryskibacteria bacterium RIFCSPLOWO2_02_FULL_51_21]|uniref:Uncharacterized protein n=1 Tax=Candidatus Zambryskibacteria bacterium RIFCSPHIGHO2_02_FULL_43_37 TaxID=1802749 RepID=A0A1G2TGP2_9BACT|nr:MAG: hypothetical protein A2723_01905 [Candidatus Zambryskibacteria bacterium RIFCSPHIGHO2_01_FULL_52_18]OHA96450.1 MAG: hypothetical protein A3D49_00995 [Candidatus Zambryskibacteria bacterium RIFCSPHIGHO2_02_FULL_43_37]OHB11289.1 MAG: hypothetical protein A3J09_01905 [Candidatus Zambryskibacteria bacterium RIFCSPLOWO2_02_FULL_51_21]